MSNETATGNVESGSAAVRERKKLEQLQLARELQEKASVRDAQAALSLKIDGGALGGMSTADRAYFDERVQDQTPMYPGYALALHEFFKAHPDGARLAKLAERPEISDEQAKEYASYEDEGVVAGLARNPRALSGETVGKLAETACERNIAQDAVAARGDLTDGAVGTLAEKGGGAARIALAKNPNLGADAYCLLAEGGPDARKVLGALADNPNPEVGKALLKAAEGDDADLRRTVLGRASSGTLSEPHDAGVLAALIRTAGESAEISEVTKASLGAGRAGPERLPDAVQEALYRRAMAAPGERSARAMSEFMRYADNAAISGSAAETVGVCSERNDHKSVGRLGERREEIPQTVWEAIKFRDMMRNSDAAGPLLARKEIPQDMYAGRVTEAGPGGKAALRSGLGEKILAGAFRNPEKLDKALNGAEGSPDEIGKLMSVAFEAGGAVGTSAAYWFVESERVRTGDGVNRALDAAEGAEKKEDRRGLMERISKLSPLFTDVAQFERAYRGLKSSGAEKETVDSLLNDLSKKFGNDARDEVSLGKSETVASAGEGIRGMFA